MVKIDVIQDIVDRKCKEMHLSYRSLANKSGIKNHSQISRILSGDTTPTQSMLARLCEGLECTKDERIAVFHAAGYLSPDEI